MRNDLSQEHKAQEKKMGNAFQRSILERDGFKCVYCGSDAEVVDHIITRKRGGQDSLNNFAACCRCCNVSKRNKFWRLWLYDRDMSYSIINHWHSNVQIERMIDQRLNLPQTPLSSLDLEACLIKEIILMSYRVARDTSAVQTFSRHHWYDKPEDKDILQEFLPILYYATGTRHGLEAAKNGGWKRFIYLAPYESYDGRIILLPIHREAIDEFLEKPVKEYTRVRNIIQVYSNDLEQIEKQALLVVSLKMRLRLDKYKKFISIFSEQDGLAW